MCVRDVKKSTTMEYFAATPTMAALRLFLALACAMALEIQIADLVTAVMHAPLGPDEKEYCEPCAEDKEGMIVDDPHLAETDYVWELNKARNGLRKSPKKYQIWFASVMKKCAFKQVLVDSKVFVDPELKVMVGVHVDDLLAAGPPEGVKETWRRMSEHIKMKVMNR